MGDRWHAAAGLTALAALAIAGCGGDDSTSTSPAVTGSDAADGGAGPVIDPGDGGSYSVELDPADFTSVVDNPYLPFLPGARWVYESRSPDGEVDETITIDVLDDRRTVMGIEATVVHDVVADPDGEVTEDTYDWYAQDADGNVWYLGEDTTAYEDGVASDAGAWEAGVGGALPGIVMPATPAVSDTGYRQEYAAGEAEDMGQIIAVSGSVTVPFGTFDDIVQTRDWTPLEPDVVEEKTYARDVGFVFEVTTRGDGTGGEVVLVEHTPGSGS